MTKNENWFYINKKLFLFMYRGGYAMKALVTGGAGYNGSTICSALIDNGHTPVVLDSLRAGTSS